MAKSSTLKRAVALSTSAPVASKTAPKGAPKGAKQPKVVVDVRATLREVYDDTRAILGARVQSKALAESRAAAIGALKASGMTAACFKSFYADSQTFGATLRDVLKLAKASTGKASQATPSQNARVRECISVLCEYADIKTVDDIKAEKGNKLKPVKEALRQIAIGVGVEFPKETTAPEKAIAKNILAMFTATRGVEKVLSAITGELAALIAETPGGVTIDSKTLNNMEDAFMGIASEIWDASNKSGVYAATEA